MQIPPALWAPGGLEAPHSRIHQSPQSLSPQGRVYPSPTPPHGPWTGGSLPVREPFGLPEPFKELIKNQTIFQLIFYWILAPFGFQNASQNQPKSIKHRLKTKVELRHRF